MSESILARLLTNYQYHSPCVLDIHRLLSFPNCMNWSESRPFTPDHSQQSAMLTIPTGPVSGDNTKWTCLSFSQFLVLQPCIKHSILAFAQYHIHALSQHPCMQRELPCKCKQERSIFKLCKDLNTPRLTLLKLSDV